MFGLGTSHITQLGQYQAEIVAIDEGRLAEIAALYNEPRGFGLVASDPAVSRLI